MYNNSKRLLWIGQAGLALKSSKNFLGLFESTFPNLIIMVSHWTRDTRRQRNNIPNAMGIREQRAGLGRGSQAMPIELRKEFEMPTPTFSEMKRKKERQPQSIVR